MAQTPEEQRIHIQAAINALTAETGFPLQWQLSEAGQLSLQLSEMPACGFTPMIKNWAAQTTVGILIEQLARLPQPAILIADYINTNMGEALKAAGFAYIDQAGNAWVNAAPLYLNIKGNRAPETAIPGKEPNGRAFSSRGLKVVYALLTQPELVQASYRDIAAAADVALGTITWVMNDLKAAGYLQGDRRSERVIVQPAALLDRWANGYIEKLKGKHLIGRYRPLKADWWQHINALHHNACWGDDIAALQYTGKPEQPEHFSLWLGEKQINSFQLVAGLQADPTGPVKIYRPFWQHKNSNGLIHPMLSYADLLATAEPSRREVARQLYQQRLQHYWAPQA